MRKLREGFQIVKKEIFRRVQGEGSPFLQQWKDTSEIISSFLPWEITPSILEPDGSSKKIQAKLGPVDPEDI